MTLIQALLLLGILVSSQANSFRIAVIEGEGSVNVIQQKTATNPIVEVRDRNNLPVPGATVTFTIGGHSASFAGGAQTMTVATDAAGRAAALGLNPIGSGSFQIQVAASYQGQTAAATIAQSNMATAAAAGGGISAMTIGIVGAAVGGGAIVATQVVGKNGNEGGPTTYTGTFSGQMVLTLNGNSGVGPYTCTSTRAVTGTLKLELEDQGGTLHGRFEAKADQPEIARTGICEGAVGGQPQWASNGDVSATAANLTFSQTTDTSAGGNRGSQTVAFSGTLSGGVVSGTLSYDSTLTGAAGGGSGFVERASMTYQVTAR